jgi:hypothetical protein
LIWFDLVRLAPKVIGSGVWLYQARLGWMRLDYQGVAERARVRNAECGMRSGGRVGGQIGAAIPPPEGGGIDGLFIIHHNGQFSRSVKGGRCRGDTKRIFRKVYATGFESK